MDWPSGHYALISVSDKRGVVNFAKTLKKANYQILSTGGTFSALKKGSIEVTKVEEYTEQKEILGGRVKTLHPKLHASILYDRSKKEHTKYAKENGVLQIDLVVVNLYPFSTVIKEDDHTIYDALENIDIGGPTLLRAAAKNYPSVTVVSDPDDYDLVADEILNYGGIAPYRKKFMAYKAFRHVAKYDDTVYKYLKPTGLPKSLDDTDESYINTSLKKEQTLKYGENPHQKGFLYLKKGSIDTYGIAHAKKLHGAELSYLNYLDANTAWEVVNSFGSSNVCVVVKHNNPCGLSKNNAQRKAFLAAVEGDKESSYGGIIGFNTTVTEDTAKALKGHFLDLIVAPGYEKEALDILQKRKKLKVLSASYKKEDENTLSLRPISGGVLVQQKDLLLDDFDSWQVVTKKPPTDEQLSALKFAWKVCRFVSSNAVVVSKNDTVVGVGCGQPSRLRSVEIALKLAQQKAVGAVLASDAFFPFSDGVKLAYEAGINAVVQPGGSIRDNEVIEEANRSKMAMVFTNRRAFSH